MSGATGQRHSWTAEGDYRAAARRRGDTLVALTSVRHIQPTLIAQSYVMAGENSQALDWLELSFEERDPMMPYLSADPILDPLRDDPRFQALRRRLRGAQPSGCRSRLTRNRRLGATRKVEPDITDDWGLVQWVTWPRFTSFA